MGLGEVLLRREPELREKLILAQQRAADLRPEISRALTSFLEGWRDQEGVMRTAGPIEEVAEDAAERLLEASRIPEKITVDSDGSIRVTFQGFREKGRPDPRPHRFYINDQVVKIHDLSLAPEVIRIALAAAAATESFLSLESISEANTSHPENYIDQYRSAIRDSLAMI